MKKKAFAYLRISTSGQIGNSSFDRQREAIAKFAKSAGMEIVKIYEEQISGTKDEAGRPKFNEMLTELLSNGVRTIIVERADRLARWSRVAEQLLYYLCSKDIELYYAASGENVTEAIMGDPASKLMVQFINNISEFERSLIIQRLKKGREKIRRETGKCEGPIGYAECDKGCKDGEHSDRCMKEKSALNLMAKLRNRKPRPLSYSKIATSLNELGIKPRNAEQWNFMLIYQLLNKKKHTNGQVI
jgi:site-specific DNA recombinase